MVYVSRVLLIHVEADSAELMDLSSGRQRVVFGYHNCVSCSVDDRNTDRYT